MSEDLSIFQEIDEALRVDNFEKFLRSYGKLIIAGCICIVLATAFSVFWKGHVKENNLKDTDILIRADELSQSGKNVEAAQGFKEVEQNTYGIAIIAKLERAKMLLAEGKPAEAETLYKEITNFTGSGSDEALRSFAALNAAALADASAGEQKPSSGGSVFSAMTQELYALALKKEGKTKEARDILDNIASNPELLISEHKRAEELRDGIKGKQP